MPVTLAPEPDWQVLLHHRVELLGCVNDEAKPGPHLVEPGEVLYRSKNGRVVSATMTRSRSLVESASLRATEPKRMTLRAR